MLSDAEKERVRYHLGYPNISVGTSLALGIPDASQLQFVLEAGMNNLLPAAEPGVRRAVEELDCIEDQMSDFRASLQVAQVGSTRFAGSAGMVELENQYRGWAQRLADTLGSPLNPFSLHHQQLGSLGGGVVEPM